MTATDFELLSKKRHFWFKAIWISLLGIAIPIVFGIAGTVFGMFRSFDNLSESGMGDPEVLADNIGIALWTALIGFLIAFIAFCVLIVAAIRFLTLRKQAEAL